MGWLFSSDAERLVEGVIEWVQQGEPDVGEAFELLRYSGRKSYLLSAFTQLPIGGARTEVISTLETRRGTLSGQANERLNAVIDYYRENQRKPPTAPRTPYSGTGVRG